MIQLEGKLTKVEARALLKLRFSDDVESNMRWLLSKAKKGTATESEQEMMELYGQMACLLDILHSYARRALQPMRSSKK